MITYTGREDNQCGLAVDLAKHLQSKYKGIDITIHDADGLNIFHARCDNTLWMQLRALLKGIAREAEHSCLEMISDDELQITSHYHFLDYFKLPQ